jgi:hypothetical protein
MILDIHPRSRIRCFSIPEPRNRIPETGSRKQKSTGPRIQIGYIAEEYVEIFGRPKNLFILKLTRRKAKKSKNLYEVTYN